MKERINVKRVASLKGTVAWDGFFGLIHYKKNSVDRKNLKKIKIRVNINLDINTFSVAV